MTERAEQRTFIERQLNEQRVLRVLQDGGTLSRKQVAERAGVSYPTVSKIIETLVASGLVEELDDQYSGQGRPGKVYRLPVESRQVAGLVIGPVKCDLVAGRFDGRLAHDSARRFATPRRRATLLNSIQRQVGMLREQAGGELSGIGVSVPGLIQRDEGRIIECPNLKQLDGCRLRAELEDRLAMPVQVVQSMHAQLLAERMHGLARGVDHFVLLNFHGGLGICVSLDGRVMRGATGLAGEFGHITVEPEGPVCGCGNRGCLETLATDKIVAESVSRRTGRELDIEDVLSLAEAGVIDATAELERATDYLAIGVAAAINTFNPEVLLVSGRFLSASPALSERLRAAVGRRALKTSFEACRIEITTRPPQQAELRGAVASIVHELTLGSRERLVQSVIGV